MKFRGLILIIILMLLNQGLLYGWNTQVIHNGSEGVEWHYCQPQTAYPASDPCINGNVDNTILSIDTISPFNLNNPDSNPYWKGLYSYRTDKRIIFTGRYTAGTDSSFSFDANNIDFSPYLTPQTVSSVQFGGTYVGKTSANFMNKDLQGDRCSAIVNSQVIDIPNKKITFNSTLNPLTKITTSDTYAVPQSLLKNYYYMKAEVKADLYKGSTYITSKYSDTNSLGISGYAGQHIDFLQPGQNTFVFSGLLTDSQIESLYGSGTYYWHFVVTPVDLKCDFDNSMSVDDISERIIRTFASNPIVIQPDSDNDTIPDSIDLCPNTWGTIRGCPALKDLDNDGVPNFRDKSINDSGYDYLKGTKELYSINCPDPSILSFNPFTQSFSCSYDNWAKVSNVTCDAGIGEYSGCSRIGGEGVWTGDGRYGCFENLGGADMVHAICDVEYNGPDTTEHTFDIDYTSSDDLIHSEGDIRKVIYDLDTSKTYFINKDNSKTQINIPLADNDYHIQVYKNNAFYMNETIRPEYIALKAHKIVDLNNSADMQNFVTNSYNLMTKLNITKNIIDLGTKSRIQIKLEIPQTERINLTLYQVLPLAMVNNGYHNIKVINNGTGELFTTDMDPVIGWYFNESASNETIEYEIPGSGEGGTIIITEEPILYNEGHLVVNYRDSGYASCLPNEAHLFNVDDLYDSKVYAPNTPGIEYKVCVAYTLDDLKADTSFSNPFHIFNYTNGANMSMTQLMNLPVDISVDDTGIYWDLKIQKDNPTGDYSCLGSIANTDNSLFGDCGYTTKRLWLHLGEDTIAPTTTLSYPYVAHKMKVELDAVDNTGGSGVDKTYYCIESDTNDCSNPFSAQYSLYTGPFLVTCNNRWGCLKNAHYFSTDIAGNAELPENEYELTLIDQGSACQIDCTSKPKPNRYLKECRNLNGCEYYRINSSGDYDDGAYVAKQCHYMLEHSWVPYNSTHEIQCPIGPFRPKMFTQIELMFKGSFCEDVITIPYNVLINGESVKMDIVYCQDAQ